MNKAQLKELVKNIMTEESEYQVFFKKALEKAGKSIPSMSDEEKKAFFDKIDATWDGKGEKNEGNAFGAAVTAAKKAGEDEFEVGGETYKVEEKLVGGQKKLDVDGDGEIEASDLADLRASKNELTFKTGAAAKAYRDKHKLRPGTKISIKGIPMPNGQKKVDEVGELPKATIPSAVKSKLDMAIDKIKDSDLTYNQKIQVVGKVMDSLGIDKAEFNKMASKLKGTMESVNEGKKRFKQQDGVGSSKYTISYHDGKKKHKDGSDFFDIKIFKNKPELEAFKKDLVSKGFVSESVNEGIWPKSKLSDRFEFELDAELKKNFKGRFYVVGHDLYHNDKKVLTIDGDKDSINVIVKKLKSTIKESVNEGSHGMATKLLQSIVSGDSSRAEGTKMSKELAQHYIDWIRTSPFGKKNGNLPLDMLVKASFNWGIERGLDPKLKGELSKLKSTIKESVNEAKYREAKDDWGVRLVQAINNNVKGLHTSVIREKRDVKEVIEAFGTMLKNAIKETLKHKYKPHPKAKDADDKIKTFISELKKFENIVDMVIAKPTKVGITKLDDAWRSIWNHKYAAEIALAGNVFDSIIEGVSPKEMDAIKSAVQSASSFMGIGSELKKLGMKYTFATEPLPIYIIQPTPNNKVAIVNKKYASKPDFVYGDIAVGVMESKTGKSVNEGRAFINAARKAKTEGLTEFEFNGKKYPVTIKD